MAGYNDLLRKAAAGSVSAHLGLVDYAIAAGATGMCRQIEAFAAAETWARLAAAAGGKDEHRALVRVLLARSDFEIERGGVYAGWYEGEARRILELLATLDDADAPQALEELGGAPGVEHDGPGAIFSTNLAAAARGDLAALEVLCDEAFRLLREGQCDPIEALTAGELYARLASTSCEAGHMRRLAGALLKRAEYEYRDGSAALADNAVAEAAVLLSTLVDTGEHSMAPWLSTLANEASMRAMATAIVHRPTILKFIDTQGGC